MKLESGMADSSDRPRIVIVGAGFAGFHCARALDRRLGSTAELILVNPVDHMVYSALLPEVVGGVVDPRCVATPLAATSPSAHAPCARLKGANRSSRGTAWCSTRGR
jgi:NADH:ubiquinone reductase (H+-translocating)